MKVNQQHQRQKSHITSICTRYDFQLRPFVLRRRVILHPGTWIQLCWRWNPFWEMRWSLRGFSKNSLRSHSSENHLSRNEGWPFPFIAKVPKGTDSSFNFYTVRPHNDFQLLLDGFPHLLVEVCSDPKFESDRYRILIQAGCTVRIANKWRPSRTSSFILMALYINQFLRVDRYLLCQPDPTKPLVCSHLLVCSPQSQAS
jgi:hypothetical protein